MKKHALIIILLSFISITSFAQEWVYDLNQAKELAKIGDKKIILVFQGSDWCGPCMKLDRKIWQSNEFKDYAKDHFVMLKADFPRRKKNQLSDQQKAKNEKLAEKYNSKGYFPLVVVMDKDANVLKETGYKKLSPKEYIEHLNSK